MNIFDDDDEVIADTTNFNINKEYAKRYEHNKKREQTQQLQEKYKNELNDSGSIDSESDSEVEDENGELITPQIDAQIMKTIALIRAKDNEVYDQSKTFFSESDLNHAQQLWEQKKSTQSKEKPIYLKDYHRDNLLGNNKNKDDTLTFTEQQSVVKDELKNAIQEFDATNEDSEDLFTIRKKDENEEEIENKAYQEFLLSQMYKDEPDKSKWVDIKRNGQMDEDQQFLMDFILNKGWVDKDATKLPTFEEITKHDLTDEEDEERMEQFENAYNFRYEEEGSSKVITHARNVPGVVRRENSARVIKRQTLKERKEEEKKQRQEELKRLKNLKMEELEKKLKQIQDMAGGELIGFDSSVLEADFDPDNYDQKMNEVFADEYYKDQELKKSGKPKKPVFEDDIDISDLIDEVPKASKKRKKTATAYVEELLKDVDNDANDEGAPIIGNGFAY
ncbi:KRI1-like family-domain-containing protein [Globomyces pollinis-pini]|nr:KRI1-like family-domain-containing protein [Globomyces pollinis-pini]